MYQITQDPAELAACAATYVKTSVANRLEVETDEARRWKCWIMRIGEGDTNALAALYDESSTIVFSLLLHILRDRQAADKMLIEVYHHVRQEADEFVRCGQTPFAWLITLARNLAVRHRSHKPHQIESPVFNFALGQLTKEQRLIIEMTYFGGLTAPEVADILGHPLEYVVRQICQAVNKLKESGGMLKGF